MVAFNNTVIDLKLGSLRKQGKNRLGKEGGYALSAAISQNNCLIQFLDLKGTSLTNDEL